MNVLDKLSTSLNRKDEVPNQELAKKIAKDNDKKAVKELFENINNKNKGIQGDCIKVIYEIGEVKPQLIAGFADALISLLHNKNNRLQWGAMTALDTITNENPKKIYSALPSIIDVADKGSVITNDHCVAILTKLCAIEEFADDAFSLLNQRLIICPTNQLPMYAEKILPVVPAKSRQTLIKTLTARLDDIEKETKKQRVEKVIKKLNK